MLAPNTILQNRYRVIRQLGRGGMGTVYEAIDQRLSSVVALKETLVEMDELRRAFEREAALLANLRHRSLPKVIDHFTEEDGQYLVMEFIPGNDLAQLLELRGRPFDPAEVLRWADELLGALKYLHTRTPPIIHRDIKPANLKLTAEGEIILLDFGLAKGAAGQMTSQGASKSIVGYTMVYAPLEQIMGAGTDARSDLYSLAATVYHLITNALPLDAPTRFAIVEDEQPDSLKKAHELNPAVPEAVSEILYQAMAIRRKDRPASAEEMRRSLREAARALTVDPREAATIIMPPTIASHPSEGSREERRETDESIAALPPTLKKGLEAAKTETASTISSPTQPSPPAHTGEQQSAAQTGESARPAPTIQANQESARSWSHGSSQTPTVRRKSRAPLFIGVTLLLLLTSVGIWMFGDGTSNQSSTDNQQTASTQTNANQTSGTSSAGVPEGMVAVPGGTFTMGRNDGDEFERPAHQVTVKPFYIDTYEVTNEDYAKFVKATGHNPPTTWTGATYPAGAAQKPVTGVTWDDATAYAKWAGKRLPTEEEWEYAARGTDGRIYPWGNNWTSGLANAGNKAGGLTDVGVYRGRSPFGAFDMVGNAWEWTASDLKSYPGGSIPAQVAGANVKVIRGGMFASDPTKATTTYRRGWPASGANDYSNTGFRCVRDVIR
ncbi:MAG TPA: SUMF1/EgtB/PvdO family nonheme iron enzyme [Pyrinomonadaceae bacterium]|nr:SUMF1/EgtB/PvdO family nonheme iron enzyme [Pyrinomonadaceae bacterium]